MSREKFPGGQEVKNAQEGVNRAIVEFNRSVEELNRLPEILAQDRRERRQQWDAERQQWTERDKKHEARMDELRDKLARIEEGTRALRESNKAKVDMIRQE